MILSPRLERCFAQLQKENRGGLVTFVTAGDPDIKTSTKILNGLPVAGADIIELGMPFSDPMADGPAIQLANIRALNNGMCLQKTLDMVSLFRQKNSSAPIILMGYYNPIYHYGVQCFLDNAVRAGVDGLIIVDLPPEEDEELYHPCLLAGIHWIRLTTPTSNSKRLEKILKNSSGFVYHVSIAGITGTSSAVLSEVKTVVANIRNHTNLPVAVGFGIKTPEQVNQICTIADAAVVGSALVNIIKEGTVQNFPADQIADNVHSFVSQLAQGTH